jgi:V8-like Glu-specific endopeptidase
MMVNSKGHLYAAPPGTTMQGPAVSMQQNRLLGAAAAFTAGDSFESLPPSDATAPILDPADINYAAASSSSSSSSDGGLAVGRKLAGIIGRDTRQEIRTTPKYPLSAAGHLMFTNPDDKQRYQCSGTLVGTFVVLTAAHCVVARSGEVQEDITFTAAETSRNHAGLGAANGVRVYFNSGYLGTGQDWTNWDLGMVVLDKPLGVNSHDAFQQELQQQQLQQQAVSVSARRGQGPSRRRDDADRHGGLSEAPGTVGYAASPRLDGSELISAGMQLPWTVMQSVCGTRAQLRKLAIYSSWVTADVPISPCVYQCAHDLKCATRRGMRQLAALSALTAVLTHPPPACPSHCPSLKRVLHRSPSVANTVILVNIQ